MTENSLSGPLIDHIAATVGDGDAAVAVSGGVDSAVVLAAAVRAVGASRVTAVTARSPAVPEEELAIAAATARAVGVTHEVVATDEGADPGYVRNSGDRCYFCKQELYGRIAELATARAAAGVVLLDGTNADDLGDHRPGRAAAVEAGVRSPLAEVGLTKADVRAVARAWGLAVAEKPAQPCLASRVAYGVAVTPERLRRVERAERFLRERFGLEVLRVRSEAGEHARIEVPRDAIERLNDAFAGVERELLALGFASVSVDPVGFRSGSLNAALPTVSLSG